MRRAVALSLLLTLVSVGCVDAGETDDGSQHRASTSTAVPRGDSSTGVVPSPATGEPDTDRAASSATTATTSPDSPTSLGSTTSIATTNSVVAAATSDVPTATPYVVPVDAADAAGWGDTHAGYPATDVFVACGAEIVSPVNGTAVEVRTVDSWEPHIDNPATRGGRSVTIVGDDGVRYYLAHFDVIDSDLRPGDRVGVGVTLGTMGTTGRSSACHAHFGISPPCPDKEWSVRRGVVAPAPYLDAWRRGDEHSPAVEVAQWAAANPDACALASLDPYAANG